MNCLSLSLKIISLCFSKNYLPYFVSVLLLISCKTENKTPSPSNDLDQEVHLGDISLEISGNEHAKTLFEKGLLLLHSFEYEDARTAFTEAQVADPKCAMAYWGEAMTHNHSLWHQQERETADSILQLVDSIQMTEGTYSLLPLEQDFLQAAHILFGEGSKKERDVAYKNFMEDLYNNKYPNHHEVGAFYALSLLGAVKGGRDVAVYEQGARIAQGIIAENPHHPGALHYLIHSFDDPVHAHLAKSAADSYSKVAPDAAHALHMPSHIYVAMGMWDNVIQSNIASWNASIKRMEKQGLDDNARSYHALNWLQYGFLQNGETEKAAQLLEAMTTYCERQPEKQARAYLVNMKGAQLVETNNWSDSFAKISVETEDLSIVKSFAFQFLEGMKAYHEPDPILLDTVIAQMNRKRQASAFYVENQNLPMCGAGGWAGKPPNQLDIDMCQVMEMELKAYAADLKGNSEAAGQWFQKACELDESLSYSYGPPSIIKPVHEAYGEWLLKQNQAQSALTIFEQSLKRHPKRLLSLKGKRSAAEQLNKSEIVAALDEVLNQIQQPKKWGEIL